MYINKQLHAYSEIEDTMCIVKVAEYVHQSGFLAIDHLSLSINLQGSMQKRMVSKFMHVLTHLRVTFT